jgi:hypothetical protein
MGWERMKHLLIFILPKEWVFEQIGMPVKL